MSENSQVVYMSERVFLDIKATIGRYPAETGGMLGMLNGYISDFYFDNTADVTFGQYSPDSDTCSRILNAEWFPKGIRLCGFIHSHSVDPLPSESDKQYMQKIYTAVSRANNSAPSHFYLFIALSPQSTSFSLHAYSVQSDCEDGFCLSPTRLDIC